jgi:hypothetical protein
MDVVCRMPACQRPVENRGLCHKHRQWLQRPEGHAKRVLAERHAVYLRTAPARSATLGAAEVPDLDLTLADAYGAGHKIDAIARAHGISTCTIYEAVRRAGLPLRNKKSAREENGPGLITPARLGVGGRGHVSPVEEAEAAPAVAALTIAIAWECPGCGWDSRQTPPRCPKCGGWHTQPLKRPAAESTAHPCVPVSLRPRVPASSSEEDAA